QAGGGDPVTFETLRDITLLPVHVVRAASSHRATVADHTEALASGEAKEPLFSGVQEVERFLYLGDDRLNAFNEEAAVDLFGEAMAPENAFVNIGSYIFLPVDQGKSFNPFGEEPKFDCALYLGHKELFAAPEARIRIEAQLVEPSVVPSPEGSPDLMVFWEYWNGRKWAELGKTSPMGVSGVQGQYNFLDSTGAF